MGGDDAAGAAAVEEEGRGDEVGGVEGGDGEADEVVWGLGRGGVSFGFGFWDGGGLGCVERGNGVKIFFVMWKLG